jgi:glyoxylase-like metal-dependent hydrolase (beta-lactamase superfamily II)
VGPYRVGASWVLGDIAVDASEPLDVRYVLLTHHHKSHVAGLPATSAKAVVANPFEAGLLSDEARARSYVAAVLRRAGFAGDVAIDVPRLGVRFEKISAGWIDLDEASAQVIPCGSHTWGHTCYLFEEGVFVGDLGGWVVSVSSLIRAIQVLRTLGNKPAYPAHDAPTTAAEYAERLSSTVRGLLRAYRQCVRERTPYRMALCARGDGDPLRLSEEGIAFLKYLAEVGEVKILVRGGRYYAREV